MKDQFKRVMKVVLKVAPIFLFIGIIMLCTITPAVVAQGEPVRAAEPTAVSTTATTVVTTTTMKPTTTTTKVTTTVPTTTTTRKTTTKPTEETTIFYETTTKAQTQVVTTTTVAQTVSAPTGEYATAREIWNYMKAQGWNDYVCAGIMGNMMAEVGGNTLSLQSTIYSPGGSYYGICQWSTYYFPEISGASLSSQLNFLTNTMASQINMFSGVHGYTYNSFLQIQDAQTAARAFAEAYERCASSTYSIRMKNASMAYAYFVG